MTKIVINGREVEADPKKPLIAACHDAGFEVPHYCYHPGLSAVGSCRICQVEVKQGTLAARVAVACRTPVAEGMLVDTESKKAHDARRECLEFLLKNHPLDCPICDKAGECDLQDYSFQEGQAAGRSLEPRRRLDKRKSLGEVIVLDEERCILCSRCVRFMAEVPRSPQLTVAGLGSRSVIATWMDRPLSGNYQGNLADVCPVGALTLSKFRFQARVWNLRKSLSTCAECSRGCATTVEVLRGGDVKRVRPRYDERVNRWWMCDEGRFAFERWNAPRLERALARAGWGGTAAGSAAGRAAGAWQECALEEALEIAADLFGAAGSRALVASPFCTVEEGRALLALARALGCAPAFVAPPASALADEVLHTAEAAPNARGLAELGFERIAPETARARAASAEATLLAGERIGELVGTAELAALDEHRRLVVMDVELLDAPAADVCLPIAWSIEKQGTWINADGIPRRLTPGRATGAARVEDVAAELVRRLAARAPAIGSAIGDHP
jgi:NADH-quinone oxidoreductase subunit G